MDPSPRYLGADVNALELSFDRGTMSTVEATYHETAKSAWSSWSAIHSLPQDHVEWQQRQAESDDTRRQEDRLWALEDCYNDRMLQKASEEAVTLRRERKQAQERRPVVSEETISAEVGPNQEAVALAEDYWLSAAKVASGYHAKGLDCGRSTCGLWKIPHQRPLSQGRSVANCGGTAFRGDSGLQARARRRADMELREVNTATPTHPCGPGPCFPLHSEPPRLDALP